MNDHWLYLLNCFQAVFQKGHNLSLLFAIMHEYKALQI